VYRGGAPPATSILPAAHSVTPFVAFSLLPAIGANYGVGVRRLTLVDNVLQDIRFAVRQLRKSPAFTCTSVCTLALGLCASVAIFSFVDAALIRPLPYANPSRLVGVFERVPMFAQSNLSYADYLDWKKLNTVFSSLAAYQGGGATLATPEGAQRAPSARVSDDFFRTLGVAPFLGRDFQPGEDLPAAPRTVLLSYAAWQNRYGGQADVLGRKVTLNDEPNIIIGVLPAEFHFAPAGAAEFWTTLHASNSCDLRRSCHNLYGVARLRDGVSVRAAQANMVAFAQQLEQQYPDSNRGQGAAVVGLTETIVGNIRPILLVLLSGAALLLLIATVNVAGLLLVRSESRKREIAVRRALGASFARVVRQFVTEGLVLVAAGGALGLAGAWWAAQLLTRLVPARMIARMPFLNDVGLNLRVALFAAGIASIAAVLCAMTPVLHLSLSTTRDGLIEGSRGAAGTTWRRLGSKLVVVELAMAMVLLAGAGLLGKSLYRVLHVDVGMQPDRLATLTIAAPGTYSTDQQLVALERRVLERVAAIPGVTSVAATSRVPFNAGNTTWIRVDGRPYHGEHNEVQFREVSASYFTALEARLVRGRHFTEQDGASAPPVAIINGAMARQYFPGEDPIGQRLVYAPTSTRPAMEIIGVVDDIKEGALDAATAPTMYLSSAQSVSSSFSIVARTSQSEQAVLPALTAAIHEIDPGISAFFPSTMKDLRNESPSAYLRRLSASLVGGFAALAWLLGIVGLYGVVAYSVSQRTREIGVRMALGAGRGAVHRLILREAGVLVAAGIAIGLVASIAAATSIRGLLFGVRSWDAPTLLAVAGVLGVSALLASYVPAQRAAAVNPVEALRAE
jgi:predicted permease